MDRAASGAEGEPMEPTAPTRAPVDVRRLWHKLPVRLGVCGAAALAVLGVGAAASAVDPPGARSHRPRPATQAPAATSTPSTSTSTTVVEDATELDVGHFFDHFVEQGLPWRDAQPGDALPWDVDVDEPATSRSEDTPSGAPAPGTWVDWTPIIARVPVALSHPGDWAVSETNDPMPKVDFFSPDTSTAGVSVFSVDLAGRTLDDYAESVRTGAAEFFDDWEETSFEPAEVFGRDGYVLVGDAALDGSELQETFRFTVVDGEAVVVQSQKLVGGDPSVTSLADELVASITIVTAA